MILLWVVRIRNSVVTVVETVLTIFPWLRNFMKNGCPYGPNKSSKSTHWAPLVDFLMILWGFESMCIWMFFFDWQKVCPTSKISATLAEKKAFGCFLGRGRRERWRAGEDKEEGLCCRRPLRIEHAAPRVAADLKATAIYRLCRRPLCELVLVDSVFHKRLADVYSNSVLEDGSQKNKI